MSEKNIELKKLVKESIRLGKKYYATRDNRDIIPAWHGAESRVKEINPRVENVLTNSTIFYLNNYPPRLTYNQIYHIIDYLCGTNLESTKTGEMEPE